MGRYLNPGKGKFQQALNSEIYIDKTGLLSYTNRVLLTEQKYICVSRPRRFGKSMAADMLAAYYSRGEDSGKMFQTLAIGRDESFRLRMNQFDVIKLNMQEFLSRTKDVDSLLQRIQSIVLRDLFRAYPKIDYYDREDLIECMNDIYEETKKPFVIIVDEWDCIFREYPHDEEAQKKYLDFLRDWLKDRENIGLVYMTGILPVKKYGTHSALNMFTEYSMENPDILAEYVGFTDEEVQALCRRYGMDLQECRAWYNGYYFPDFGHVYNPNSIVRAMLSGQFTDYWNRTETYEALKTYIDLNFDGLRDAILALMAQNTQKIETGGFQNDMTSFTGRDDVLTLLVHLGYLGYNWKTKEAFIPNREIMLEFVTATTSGGAWDEVVRSVKKSEELLAATWAGREDKVAELIRQAHLETSHLQYNDENALSYTLSLAYFAARQYYTIVREFPSGDGFADLAFLPRKKYPDKPAMIVELKWNHDAQTAVSQILDRQYPEGLEEYASDLLLVGVNYDKATRKHECRIVRA